ncbi:MAG TPA: PAAR-like protein [Pyrinomonadaceae bacterium]|jgi:hypothetical protein
MDKDIVVDGATIECTGGTHRSFLVVPPSLKIEVDAANAANITHHKPANILNFGLCKLQPGQPPCQPVTPAPWTRGEPSIEFGIEPVLDTDSTCRCHRAPGLIRIVTSGQRNPFLSVNCRKPYSTLAEEAADKYRRALTDEYLAQLEAEEREASKGPGFWQKAAGALADLAPFAGTAKGIDEAIVGYDPFEERELSTAERIFGAIPGSKYLKRGGEGVGAGWRRVRGGGDGAADRAGREAAERASREAAERESRRIASGHAWKKHRDQFPELRDEEEFAKHINNIMQNPSAVRTDLGGGRRAYWDERSRTVVITNPKDPDGGTTFKPKNGKKYFDDLD